MARQERCGALNAKIESVGRRRGTVCRARAVSKGGSSATFMVADQSASHEGMLASNIVNRCACGAIARAADTVGKVEPGFGKSAITAARFARSRLVAAQRRYSDSELIGAR
jgi:hypothetical protein